LRAHEHVVRFVRLRSPFDDDATKQVVTLEWEPVESTAGSTARHQSAHRREGPQRPRPRS
jgi:hypothetical protein